MNTYPGFLQNPVPTDKTQSPKDPALSERKAQDRVPILEALQSYRGVTRFHMPGHRGGAGADTLAISFLGKETFLNDVTGVPGMDDLHEPQGCILEAQTLAAQAFGADKTYFSVNGTSSAIHAMALSVVNEGDTLIIPRNIHKSVLSAVILSGAKPAFVMPSYDSFLGFALGVDAKTVEACVELNPYAKATLLINPTYYGTSVDLTSVASALHKRNMALLVDEAHGPHFRFHPLLPIPALESGADAVAQGAHKLIGAFTQASYLHLKGNLIDRARMKATFQYLTTTSPSYLLMASLDLARRQMALQGRELLEYALGLSDALRESVNEIPGLYAFGEEALGRPGADWLDPTKVTITVRELGITGFQAEAYLRSRSDIQVELSDLYNVLVIVSFGNKAEDISKLLGALRALTDAVAAGELPKNLLRAQQYIPDIPRLPELALSPRKAVERPWERVPLLESVGRVSAEVVTCYPPGIPILFPGEIIGKDTVSYLDVVKRLAFGISGPEDRTLKTVRVVRGL